MLFNSLEFILLFLPITLVGFFQIGGLGYQRLAIGWLLAASIFFYSWWNPANLLLLIPSILFNYCVGSRLTQPFKHPRLKQGLLSFGIIANLGLIAYFKYANFFISTAASLTGTNFTLNEIILPLGISFFTFQQIAYLVDSYRSEHQKRYRFLDYSLFVTFFPHLIAGPLIHHKGVITQFVDHTLYRFNRTNLVVGITLFAMGLFKKVIFADGVAIYSTQIFNAAENGASLTLVEAWIGALAFTLQLYFDFSGYSDMAIGLARMFGIQLPLNFNSPYKATNIIEFWRRWHITLSNFLRDYLYIPLGGNRKGAVRRHVNLMVTMLLGGLWHGAGWTFVFWGGLHGLYLLVNHQWRSFRQRYWGHDLSHSSGWSRKAGLGLTFMAVVVGWVFFKAENLATAKQMLQGMAGLNGISLPSSLENSLAFMQDWGVQFNNLMPNIQLELEQIDDVYEIDPVQPIIKIGTLLLIVWLMPNTQQWLAEWMEPVAIEVNTQVNAKANTKANETFASQSVSTLYTGLKARLWAKLRWQPHPAWAVLSAILTAIALLNLSKVSEFLYFEF